MDKILFYKKSSPKNNNPIDIGIVTALILIFWITLLGSCSEGGLIELQNDEGYENEESEDSISNEFSAINSTDQDSNSNIENHTPRVTDEEIKEFLNEWSSEEISSEVNKALDFQKLGYNASRDPSTNIALISIPTWMRGGWQLSSASLTNAKEKQSIYNYLFIHNNIFFIEENSVVTPSKSSRKSDQDERKTSIGPPLFKDINSFLKLNSFRLAFSEMTISSNVYQIVLEDLNDFTTTVYTFHYLKVNRIGLSVSEEYPRGTLAETNDLQIYRRLAPIKKQNCEEGLNSYLLNRNIWTKGKWVDNNLNPYRFFSVNFHDKENKNNKHQCMVLKKRHPHRTFYLLDQVWGEESFALMFLEHYDFFTFKKISDNKGYVYFNSLHSDVTRSDRQIIYKITPRCDFSTANYLGKWNLIANHTLSNEAQNGVKNEVDRPKLVTNIEITPITNIWFTSNDIYFNVNEEISSLSSKLNSPHYKFYEFARTKNQYSFFAIRNGIECHYTFALKPEDNTAYVSRQVNRKTTLNHYRKVSE